MRSSDPDVGASSAHPSGPPQRWAVREDNETGVREEVGLFGADGSKIFACTHLPSTRARSGLIICSPLHAEFLHNYRKEVMLARALAEAGIAVQRFHYRGTGNSEGKADDVTFPSMLEDTRVAVESFKEKAPISSIAFLGTRVGAGVASAAASDVSEGPLVLWEPVLDPEAYLRQLFRVASIRELRHDSKMTPQTRQRKRMSMEQLETDGVVDVLGYAVHRSLFRSLFQHRLPETLGERPRDLLLLQLDQRDALRDEFATFVGTLRSSGFRVDAQAIVADEHWWFSGNPSHSMQTVRAVISETVDWLVARLGSD